MRTFTRRAGSLFRSAVLLLPLLATAPRLVQAQDDGWAPGTLLVAHRLTSGAYTISQLKLDGTLIRRFGTVSGPEWRSHLAIAGGYLFRSNGMTLNNIHRFDTDGTLVGTTTPDSSAQHQIQAIARDFDDESILLHDVYSSNYVRHLDDWGTGSSPVFKELNYSGYAGIADLFFGGPAGSEALYGMVKSGPYSHYTYQIDRLVKIDAAGNATYYDDPLLQTPYVIDTGSVAVDPNDGTMYAATTTRVLRFSASGTLLGNITLSDTKPSLGIDWSGRLYVGRWDSGQITVHAGTGTVLATLNVPDADRIVDVYVTAGEPLPDNTVPVADAGADQAVECTSSAGATVSLDGSGSSDPDGDALTYEWSVPAGSGVVLDDPTSATPSGTFPLGPTLLTLTVTDEAGAVSLDDVLITVVDTTPPLLLCTTDVIALWSPNHEYVPVHISVVVSDACSMPASMVVDCTVSSSEADDATGDGSHAGDVDGADGHSAPVSVALTYDSTEGAYVGVVELRAERDGASTGRVYSILTQVEDDSGNSGNASCVVLVPKDRRTQK